MSTDNSTPNSSVSGFIPVQVGQGVVYISPGALLAREEETAERRRAFFNDFQKSIGVQQNNANPGKKGTVFTSGRITSSTSPTGAFDKPRDTPNFAFLRTMGKQSMIDSLILKIRMDQMRRVSKRSPNKRRIPGWRVRSINADDPRFQNDDATERRCRDMEVMVERGLNHYFHPGGFRSVLINMVEDELILDRKFIVYDSIVKGKPQGWHLIDPATVKPRVDIILPEIDAIANEVNQSVIAVMAQPSLVRQAAERVSDRWQVDVTNAMYVQEVEGRIVAAWEEDECCLDIVYTSTEINRYGFGRSPLEQSLWWSLSFMRTAQYNADIFDQNYPEAVMFLYGDYEPEGLNAFKKQLLGENPAGSNWRLPVIPGGEGMKADIKKLRDTPRDMLFTQWLKMLTSFKAACFRMDPQLLNFDLVHGSDASLFQDENTEGRVSLAQEEGFESLLDGIGDFITRALIWPYYDDLVFQWVGLRPMTEMQETEMFNVELAWRTPNEIRAREGELGPIEGPDAEAGDRLLNPVWVQAQAQEHAAEMQEQQLELQENQMELQAKAAAQQAAPEASPSAGGRPHRAPTNTSPARRNTQKSSS